MSALGSRSGGGNWPLAGREARPHFEAALDVPETFGEAKHLLANQSDVHYWLGCALAAAGNAAAARRCWTLAGEFRGDFQGMRARVYSEMTYYSARALERLERKEEAAAMMKGLSEYAEALLTTPAEINDFATSLPTMLLFEQDLQKSQERNARFMLAQASLMFGDAGQARDWLEQVLGKTRNACGRSARRDRVSVNALACPCFLALTQPPESGETHDNGMGAQHERLQS